MKTFITTLSILALSAPFSFAQKGKIVRQVLKPGSIRASSAMKQIGPKVPQLNPNHFIIPVKLETHVARAALQRLEQNLQVSIRPSQDAVAQAMSHRTADANNLLLISSARSNSPLKDILNAEEMFRQWYLPEVKKANALLTQVAVMKENGTLFANQAAMEQLQTSIENTVINASLKQNLAQAIQRQDYASLVRDLADYYTLPRNYAARLDLQHLASLDAAEAFSTAAAGYLARNPHKINLKWRRLMTHPAVSAQTKEALQGFIDKNELSAAELEELKSLLTDAYRQHAQALSALRHSPEIQNAVQTYTLYITKLKDFVAEYGRLPKWNTLNRAEQNLQQELFLLTMRDNHAFEPLKSLTAELRSIIAQYTPQPVPFEESLANLQEFCLKHHRLPMSYAANPNATKREAELYDQFSYWQQRGSADQRQQIRNIIFH